MMSSTLPDLSTDWIISDAPHGIRSGVGLAALTTFRVGGAAEWLAEPRSESELHDVLNWAAAYKLPMTVLGAGSNLLISDAGLPGVVISTRYLRGIRWLEQGRFWAAAGEPMVTLARLVAKRGWGGFEWAIGIPGTVGGAVAMNAGAHALSTADSLVEANLLDGQGQPLTLSAGSLQFGYRFSLVQQRRWVVTGATFQLEAGQDPGVVSGLTQQYWEQRRTTQPYDWPSCGSVFRNPVGHSAGWLIEQSGLKGFQIGGAQVAERHANFILNRGQATAADIHQLIAHVQAEVYRQWSVVLEPEVRILGSFGSELL